MFNAKTGRFTPDYINCDCCGKLMNVDERYDVILPHTAIRICKECRDALSAMFSGYSNTMKKRNNADA